MGVVINGTTDLETSFGMRLLLDVTDNPPQVKSHIVNVPNGQNIDLTDALTGHAAYDDRTVTLRFRVRGEEQAVRAAISNALHGKRLRFSLPNVAGYTYVGRWAIKYKLIGYGFHEVTATITCEPYRYKEPIVYKLNAAGGKRYTFKSGNMPVRPVVQCEQPTRFEFGGKVTSVDAGTYRLNDVLFTEGDNELYINSFEILDTKWSDLATKSWEQLFGMTWDEVQRINFNGGNVIFTSWDDLSDMTWAQLATKKWSDLRYKPDSSDSSVVITYEWGDL